MYFRNGALAAAGLGGLVMAAASAPARADAQVAAAPAGKSVEWHPASHVKIMLNKISTISKMLVAGTGAERPKWEDDIAAAPGLQLRETCTRMAQSSADGLLLLSPPRIYTTNPKGDLMPQTMSASSVQEAKDSSVHHYDPTFCVWHFGSDATGHPNTVHGGAIAMALDESCGHAFVSLGKGVGYTAYLHVNYKVPIPAGIPVLITVKPSKIEGRKVYLAASLSDGAGKEFSNCEALFLLPRNDSTLARPPLKGEISA
eukprot:CAMPEP_0180136456 /NCGR_PEP_ID=MMETSP0986-20121125/11519_1 /TAXON_ID=697907 /ORGANISM="non described non described, Strain CCMP2293" /LENGTH=257 /DNA_ID=CAMNT_0022077513 /DNA_START=36 /DNA_END=809 /DNA_ORIENTATION=+